KCRCGSRTGDAGHDLHFDTGGCTGGDFFTAAAEDEGVAALESYDDVAGFGTSHEQIVDLVLRCRLAPRGLADVDDLDVGWQRLEQLGRAESVGDDDVGVAHRPIAAQG